MQLARVVGTATATVKHSSLAGRRLLVVQPLLADRHNPDGPPVVAVDAFGAGLGDLVIVTSDGLSIRELLQDNQAPVRWSVLGIPD